MWTPGCSECRSSWCHLSYWAGQRSMWFRCQSLQQPPGNQITLQDMYLVESLVEPFFLAILFSSNRQAWQNFLDKKFSISISKHSQFLSHRLSSSSRQFWHQSLRYWSLTLRMVSCVCSRSAADVEGWRESGTSSVLRGSGDGGGGPGDTASLVSGSARESSFDGWEVNLQQEQLHWLSTEAGQRCDGLNRISFELWWGCHNDNDDGDNNNDGTQAYIRCWNCGSCQWCE